MTDRFENLTNGVGRIYKSIRRIKKIRMNSMGLKGTHVMCMYYLSVYEGGLTAADLCGKCHEDKAGISRILSDLERLGFLVYDDLAPEPRRRKYRTRAVLTKKGRETAQMVTSLIRIATLEGGNGITDEEREIFYRVLFRIAENLETACTKLEQEEALS